MINRLYVLVGIGYQYDLDDSILLFYRGCCIFNLMLSEFGWACMDTSGLRWKCQTPARRAGLIWKFQSRGAYMGRSGVYSLGCWLVSLWVNFRIY